jgi:hypothetical protein
VEEEHIVNEAQADNLRGCAGKALEASAGEEHDPILRKGTPKSHEEGEKHGPKQDRKATVSLTKRDCNNTSHSQHLQSQIGNDGGDTKMFPDIFLPASVREISQYSACSGTSGIHQAEAKSVMTEQYPRARRVRCFLAQDHLILE